MRNFIFKIIKLVFLFLLPFIVLIRGAVYLHENYRLYAWFSLLGGMLMSAAILFLYFVFIQGSMTGKTGSLKRKSWLAFTLVAAYCFPSVLYLSAANAKHPEVKKEFSSLHPILRLGIGTIIFLDNDLVLTDAERQPEDYKKMGLKTKKHSLHYIQKDGYAHAVDIRVNGRSAVRNWLLKLYFKSMGFNTLRHVGTGDHLHVSLRSRDRPGGI
ncbi:MAG TPA: hypothetical protein ENJ95_20615 [Bacteroidetes bacterium]|nr:hypothetical protein [Bacteroidota bacterium]